MLYGGDYVPAEDAVRALEACDMVPAVPARSPVRLSVLIDTIEDSVGSRLKFPVPSSFAIQRRVTLNACREIQRAFDRRSSWKNLDKWPY